jgi:hypothetical protein
MTAYRDKITKQKQQGYFRTAHFEEVRQMTLTIAYLVEDEQVFDETKDVLYFQDDGRRLQMNVSNAETLMELLGDEPADWVGRRITLYLTTYKDAKSREQKPCIRIRAPGTNVVQIKQEKAQAAAPPAPDLKDEIPF